MYVQGQVLTLLCQGDQNIKLKKERFFYLGILFQDKGFNTQTRALGNGVNSLLEWMHENTDDLC